MPDLRGKKRKNEKLNNQYQVPTAQSQNKPLRTDTSDSDDLNNSESGTWFWNMSANESEHESDEVGQVDEEEPDIESRTEVAVPLQPVTKEICWNKEGENKLRGIYGRGSVSSARRQKLAVEKLEKEASKTYNIKALWQRNCDLGLNSKVNTSASELAESSESASGKERNSAHLLSDVTRGGTETPVLSRQELRRNQRVEALRDLTQLLNLVTDQ